MDEPVHPVQRHAKSATGWGGMFFRLNCLHTVTIQLWWAMSMIFNEDCSSTPRSLLASGHWRTRCHLNPFKMPFKDPTWMPFLQMPFANKTPGFIDVEEFIAGCCRIHGPAKVRKSMGNHLHQQLNWCQPWLDFFFWGHWSHYSHVPGTKQKWCWCLILCLFGGYMVINAAPGLVYSTPSYGWTGSKAAYGAPRARSVGCGAHLFVSCHESRRRSCPPQECLSSAGFATPVSAYAGEATTHAACSVLYSNTTCCVSACYSNRLSSTWQVQSCVYGCHGITWCCLQSSGVLALVWRWLLSQRMPLRRGSMLLPHWWCQPRGSQHKLSSAYRGDKRTQRRNCSFWGFAGPSDILAAPCHERIPIA